MARSQRRLLSDHNAVHLRRLRDQTRGAPARAAPAVDWRAHCERVVRERDDALRALDATRTRIEILELRIANLLAPEH